MAPIPSPNTSATYQRRVGAVVLPGAGRDGPVPKLPKGRDWLPETVEWWNKIWHSPMATQWLEHEPMLIRLAILQEEMKEILADEGVGAKKMNSILVEMRHIEDRYGLNPQARARLRWRIADDSRPAAPVLAMANRPKRKDPRLQA